MMDKLRFSENEISEFHKELNVRVAILYQVKTPPARNGIIKPMKAGGYSDSGADIAYSLQRQNISVITPVENPEIEKDLDWVFPDTEEGIASALANGATVLWLNTVLYKGHPIENFIKKGISVVGQIPEKVDVYDDKLATNDLLRSNGLPIPKSKIITKNQIDVSLDFPFPIVIKPIRGRGSQGVSVVRSQEDLNKVFEKMLNSQSFGKEFYVEEFLSGQEITITVMPPGKYVINNEIVMKADYWSLPLVKRFNHENGIAPYNGVVAVVDNSEVLDDVELQQSYVKRVCEQCEQAAWLVYAKAPIRIDCRANENGNYFLFDLNMKPNMTGPSRPNRLNQDSLTALSARKIGWSYDDLVLNMLHQYWRE